MVRGELHYTTILPSIKPPRFCILCRVLACHTPVTATAAYTILPPPIWLVSFIEHTLLWCGLWDIQYTAITAGAVARYPHPQDRWWSDIWDPPQSREVAFAYSLGDWRLLHMLKTLTSHLTPPPMLPRSSLGSGEDMVRGDVTLEPGEQRQAVQCYRIAAC